MRRRNNGGCVREGSGGSDGGRGMDKGWKAEEWKV